MQSWLMGLARLPRRAICVYSNNVAIEKSPRPCGPCIRALFASRLALVDVMMRGMPVTLIDRARTLLAGAPGRLTQPRVRVLATLLEAQHPETHADLQKRLPDLDRVSLYRCLDWLCEQDHAFHLTGADGVRRYGFKDPTQDHAAHPHFQCMTCGVTECLPPMQAPLARLPRGYRLTSTDVLARGVCPGCSQKR